MSFVSEDALVEGSHETVVKWWVSAPVNEDAYYFFFVRYETVSGEVKRAQYYSNGLWTAYNSGQVIEPFLILPGFVGTLIASTDPTDQRKVTEWMQETCMSILQLANQAVGESEG
jgi:hypothetical protein